MKVSEEKKTHAINPVTGDLNSTSVSAIAKFDQNEYGGCNRRWLMRYRFGFTEPTSKSQAVGTECHAQIEHYLKTGQDVLGKIVGAGKHLLTPPGTDLLVEWGLNDKPKPPPINGKEVHHFPAHESLLVLAGVPVIGFIDLINARGSYTDEGGATIADPSGTVEVNDNKTTTSVDRAKPGEELIETAQMAGYALWCVARFPGLTGVRLSHTYFNTGDRRAAIKKTALIPLASITRRGVELAAIVEQMKRVARTPAWQDVPPHHEACTAYKGKFSGGCPFFRDCFKDPFRQMQIQHGSPNQGVKTMALADKVRAQINGTPGAVQAAPQPTAPAPVAAPDPVSTAPAPVAAVPAPVRSIGCEVAACEISKHYIIDGVAMDGVFTGTSLGFGFFTTAGGDMKLPSNAIVKPIAVAPAPAPSLAASPAPVVQTAPTLVAPVASAPIAQPAAPAPVSAPVAVAAPAWASGGSAPAPTPAPAPVAAQAPAPVAEKAPRKKRTASPADVAVAGAQGGSDDLYLCVDCIPNTPFTLLDQYVSEVAGGLAKAHNLNDIRFQPDSNHPLAFGRWKGALAEAIRATPPAPGVYVVWARESEIAQVVVEALAPMCAPGALTRAR